MDWLLEIVRLFESRRIQKMIPINLNLLKNRNIVFCLFNSKLKNNSLF